MESFSIPKALIFCLVLQLTCASTIITHEGGNDKPLEESDSSTLFVNCSYGNSSIKAVKTKTLPVNINDAQMFTGNDSLRYVYKFRDLQTSKVTDGGCLLCSGHLMKCKEISDLAENICFRRSIYTGQITITSCKKYTGGMNKSSRQIRKATRCALPTLKTAAVYCRSYPRTIKCVQRCAFGYTLEDGIQEYMKCNYRENVWKPKTFRECRPFVDCNLTLKSGGSLDCSEKSEMDSPQCKIACSPFEDKDEVPARNYTCDIYGEWNPFLPFCVIPGSGLALTKAPKIKLHSDLKIE